VRKAASCNASINNSNAAALLYANLTSVADPVGQHGHSLWPRRPLLACARPTRHRRGCRTGGKQKRAAGWQGICK